MSLINRFLLSKYSRPISSTFMAVFLVKLVQANNSGVHFFIGKLFFVETCLSLRYERVNIKTKGIG